MELIFGKEEYLINTSLKEKLKVFNMQPTFYFDEDNLDNIFMDIETISMFDIDKVIVIKNHDIFYNSKLAQIFLNKLKKVNLENVNLFFVATEKISSSNSLITYLKNKAKVTEISKIKEYHLPKIIQNYVEEKGGSITHSAITKIIHKLPFNLRIIINELSKLLNENMNIDDKQVENSIGSYKTEDYFAFSNAIIECDSRRIISLYNEKIMLGENPVIIIGQIANVINLVMMISFYKKQGYSLTDISEKTKIHIFRIKKSNSLLQKTDHFKIEKLLFQLSELDKNIKIGKIDSFKGLDQFMVHLIK